MILRERLDELDRTEHDMGINSRAFQDILNAIPRDQRDTALCLKLSPELWSELADSVYAADVHRMSPISAIYEWFTDRQIPLRERDALLQSWLPVAVLVSPAIRFLWFVRDNSLLTHSTGRLTDIRSIRLLGVKRLHTSLMRAYSQHLAATNVQPTRNVSAYLAAIASAVGVSGDRFPVTEKGPVGALIHGIYTGAFETRSYGALLWNWVRSVYHGSTPSVREFEEQKRLMKLGRVLIALLRQNAPYLLVDFVDGYTASLVSVVLWHTSKLVELEEQIPTFETLGCTQPVTRSKLMAFAKSEGVSACSRTVDCAGLTEPTDEDLQLSIVRVLSYFNGGEVTPATRFIIQESMSRSSVDEFKVAMNDKNIDGAQGAQTPSETQGGAPFSFETNECEMDVDELNRSELSEIHEHAAQSSTRTAGVTEWRDNVQSTSSFDTVPRTRPLIPKGAATDVTMGNPIKASHVLRINIYNTTGEFNIARNIFAPLLEPAPGFPEDPMHVPTSGIPHREEEAGRGNTGGVFNGRASTLSNEQLEIAQGRATASAPATASVPASSAETPPPSPPAGCSITVDRRPRGSATTRKLDLGGEQRTPMYRNSDRNLDRFEIENDLRNIFTKDPQTGKPSLTETLWDLLRALADCHDPEVFTRVHFPEKAGSRPTMLATQLEDWTGEVLGTTDVVTAIPIAVNLIRLVTMKPTTSPYKIVDFSQRTAVRLSVNFVRILAFIAHIVCDGEADLSDLRLPTQCIIVRRRRTRRPREESSEFSPSCWFCDGDVKWTKYDSVGTDVEAHIRDHHTNYRQRLPVNVYMERGAGNRGKPLRLTFFDIVRYIQLAVFRSSKMRKYLGVKPQEFIINKEEQVLKDLYDFSPYLAAAAESDENVQSDAELEREKHGEGGAGGTGGAMETSHGRQTAISFSKHVDCQTHTYWFGWSAT